MLNSLKFVQGAVSKKDLIPSMSHFNIHQGRITAFNGVFSISAPINCDIDCNPDAETLIKAINKCSKTIQLSLTPTGRLSIKSGSFRTLINCHPELLPDFTPTGNVIQINGEIIYNALSELYPFAGEDASRPWSNGIRIKSSSAFATNNIILIEKWLGVQFPFEINIPRLAVRELLRVREYPILLQIDNNSVTFYYENERWIKTQQLESGWPDTDSLLNKTGDFKPVDLELFTALDHIKDFSDKLKTFHFKNNSVATDKTDNEEAATYELLSSPGLGSYSIEMVSKLKNVATVIDWSHYPKPCPFIGNNLRGIIVGVR